MAAAGAALWDRGNLLCAPAPKLVVKDTVGAGDAFMAAPMVGLTRGTDSQMALETACRLGAMVASSWLAHIELFFYAQELPEFFVRGFGGFISR